MPRREFTEEELERKHRAERIAIYRYFEKLPLADCWYKANPDSTASRKNAGDMATAEINWHRDNFPPDFESALIVAGLDEHNVFAELHKIIYSSTITRKASGSDGDYEEVSDARTRLAAIKVWGQLRGLAAGKAPRPVSLHPEHQEAAAEEQRKSELDIEASDGTKRDINAMPAREKPTDGEWEQRYAEAEDQTARNIPDFLRRHMEHDMAEDGEDLHGLS